MFLILFRFWVRRLAFTFCVAVLVLFAVNYVQHGLSRNMLINTWSWALAAAMVSSLLSTYFAFIRIDKKAKKNLDQDQVR
jgi:hypothetical protein